MKTTSLAQLIFISCICSLTFTFFGESALAQGPTPTPATHWIDGDGDWFVNANWDNGQPNCSVPMTAYINNGGGANINDGTCANSLVLGNSAGETGSTMVAGSAATLTVSGGIAREEDPDIINPEAPGVVLVGYYGKGNLTIERGAYVNNSFSYIAAAANSSGSVTVDGVGSTWMISRYSSGIPINARLFIGGDGVDPGGTALLNVRNGGSVVVVNDHNSARAITVYASGTITGNGTITTSADVGTHLTYIQGTLIPSDGTLTFTNNLELTIGATTICNVTPQSADNIQVGGYATLNGRVSVIMTGDFSAAPTRYTLLHSDGQLLSPFATESIKYPTDQGWTPHITYDLVGGNVYLDRVYNLNIGP